MKVDVSAQQHLNTLLKPGSYLRVSIEAGGCQGFEKKFQITQETDPDDCILDSCVVVDPVSLDLIGDATLVYRSNLQGSRFELMIPQATSTCGCGMSFDF